MSNLVFRVESISNVVAILGDQTDIMYSFFRDGGGKDDARTIVTGKIYAIIGVVEPQPRQHLILKSRIIRKSIFLLG